MCIRDSLWITCKKTPCAEMNAELLQRLPGDLLAELKAIHHHPTSKSYKPSIDKNDGTVAQTGFANIIPIKKGAKLMIISNLDTPDGLVNGTLCTLVDVVRTKKGEVDKLVVKSKDSFVGQRNQAKFPQLAQRYPDCFFLERITHTYSIGKRSGDIGSTASLFQFPVR